MLFFVVFFCYAIFVMKYMMVIVTLVFYLQPMMVGQTSPILLEKVSSGHGAEREALETSLRRPKVR